MSRPATPQDDMDIQIENTIVIKPRTIPLYICCPITLEIMKEPVVAIDGYSYEKTAIVEWFKNNSKLPISGVCVTNKTVYTNTALKIYIVDWLKVNPQPVPSMMDENPPPIRQKPQPQSPRHFTGMFSGNQNIISSTTSSFVNVTIVEFIRNMQNTLNREGSDISSRVVPSVGP